MKLRDKVVVITGGSSGLGYALAEQFRARGSKVIIAGKNKYKLKKAADIMGVAYLPTDVRNWGQMKHLANFAIKKFKKINIWINNAGIIQKHGSILNTNLKKAREIIDTNFFGLVHGTLLALEYIKNGAIINIISTSALNGRPRTAIYAASKWAARGFTESLKLARGVRTMAFYLGGMKTELFGKNRPSDYRYYLDPKVVAQKIITSLIKGRNDKLIIKRKRP